MDQEVGIKEENEKTKMIKETERGLKEKRRG